jgi:L-lactate permease
MAGASALTGAAFGLFPIGWIVLNAIFVYDISVKTGKFEVVKDTIAGLASDRRIQVLLIAFGSAPSSRARRARHASGHLGRNADRARLRR